MTDSQLTFTSSLEPADWRRFSQFVLRRSLSVRIANVVFLVLWAGAVCGSLYVVPDLAIVVVLTMTFSLVIFIAWRVVFARALRLRCSGYVLGEKTIFIDAQGIHAKSDKAESLYYWSALESAAVTEHLLILFLEPAVGLIIPRRALHPEDFHTLILLIRQYCPRLEADLRGV